MWNSIPTDWVDCSFNIGTLISLVIQGRPKEDLDNIHMTNLFEMCSQSTRFCKKPSYTHCRWVGERLSIILFAPCRRGMQAFWYNENYWFGCHSRLNKLDCLVRSLSVICLVNSSPTLYFLIPFSSVFFFYTALTTIWYMICLCLLLTVFLTPACSPAGQRLACFVHCFHWS